MKYNDRTPKSPDNQLKVDPDGLPSYSHCFNIFDCSKHPSVQSEFPARKQTNGDYKLNRQQRVICIHLRNGLYSLLKDTQSALMHSCTRQECEEASAKLLLQM